MTPTLAKVLDEVRTLTPSERTELRDILMNEPLAHPPRNLKLIDELWGKYKDTPGSVAKFLAQKHLDNDRDEHRYAMRHQKGQ